MTVDKFKVPLSMRSPTIDPGKLGFEETRSRRPVSTAKRLEGMAEVPPSRHIITEA